MYASRRTTIFLLTDSAHSFPTNLEVPVIALSSVYTLLTCTCGGVHPRWVESASLILHGDDSWISSITSLGVAAFISFAAQTKLVRFVISSHPPF